MESRETRRLVAQQGAPSQTTIFVTHDQDEALELSDRVAVLHGGKLQQVGSRPKSRIIRHRCPF